MQEKLLDMLISADGYISGQELSSALGVSRQAVWKAINLLKSGGWDISSAAGRGYRLESVPNHLNKVLIKKHLKTQTLARNLIVLDTVGSTNDYLKSLGGSGCQSGTLAVAREQTEGRGRLGRSWQTKKDDGIAFSFLLRPRLTLSEVTAITPLCGLAVCRAITDYTGIDCKIKWPNDIIAGRKKLAGILTEMSAEMDAVEYTVTGIGINVEYTRFPEDIAHKATSILLETGRHIDKNEFLAEVINRLETELTANDLRLTEGALKEYSSLCATLNRSVSFRRGEKSISGTAVGIDANGELKIMLSDGTLTDVNSGEVTVQGIY